MNNEFSHLIQTSFCTPPHAKKGIIKSSSKLAAFNERKVGNKDFGLGLSSVDNAA